MPDLILITITAAIAIAVAGHIWQTIKSDKLERAVAYEIKADKILLLTGGDIRDVRR